MRWRRTGVGVSTLFADRAHAETLGRADLERAGAHPVARMAARSVTVYERALRYEAT